jgi:hypothetical protein
VPQHGVSHEPLGGYDNQSEDRKNREGGGGVHRANIEGKTSGRQLPHPPRSVSFPR